MTRRIVAAMLVLTAGLVICVIFPLGLIVDRQHDRDFVDTTLDAPRVIASAAEERLADREKGEDANDLVRTIARVRTGGESVLVVDARGAPVTSAGPSLPPTGSLVARALAGASPTRRVGGRLVVAVPVHGHVAAPVGAVLFARSLAPLDRSTRDEWLLLSAASVVAVVVAVALAAGLAHWVGRPLRDLERAAEALGGGAFDTQAATDRGPVEVRRLAGRFNVMAARLKTLIHDHRIMVADVAHQLRTPLAALRLRLELLSHEARPENAADVDNSLDELNRLSRLVDGLLAVARAENATTPPVPTDVSRVVIERAEAWSPVAAERRVTLSVSAPDDVVVLAGEGHLQQALDNLIDNALTATPAGGHVGLSVIEGDPVQLRVADNGPGMPREERDEAFRRFHSGRGGTGLGLAIVHRLVTSNNGTIALEETPGGGLTVTIALAPAVRPALRSE